MSKEVLPVFRDYLDYLVSQGKLIYMKRSATAPIVKIPETQYWWGFDRTHYFDFCWHGPEAYSGVLPPDLNGRYPNWQYALRFAQSYQRRLDADSWDDAKRAAYQVTPEWVAKMDKIKAMCEAQRWSDAMEVYRDFE